MSFVQDQAVSIKSTLNFLIQDQDTLSFLTGTVTTKFHAVMVLRNYNNNNNNKIINNNNNNNNNLTIKNCDKTFLKIILRLKNC